MYILNKGMHTILNSIIHILCNYILYCILCSAAEMGKFQTKSILDTDKIFWIIYIIDTATDIFRNFIIDTDTDTGI